jgi:hypothetical protein
MVMARGNSWDDDYGAQAVAAVINALPARN